MTKSTQILIPINLITAACNHCGYLGFFVKVEAVNKVFKGKKVQVGQIRKLICGRCKTPLEVIDGVVDGRPEVFQKGKKPKITQENVDKGLII